MLVSILLQILYNTTEQWNKKKHYHEMGKAIF